MISNETNSYRQKYEVYFDQICVLNCFTAAGALSALPIASIQFANAATTYPTYSFVTATLNPAGKGQSVLVLAFLDRFPPANSSALWAPYILWDFTVTITDPSGKVQTKKLVSDTIGGAYFNFNPDQIGTWTLKMHFEGAFVNQTNDNYSPVYS